MMKKTGWKKGLLAVCLFPVFILGCAHNDLRAQEEVIWYHQGKQVKIFLRKNLLAQFGRGEAGAWVSQKSTKILKSYPGVKIWEVSNDIFQRALSSSLSLSSGKGERISPVFTPVKGGSFFMALPGGVIVHLDKKMKGDQVKGWAKKHKLKIKNKMELHQKNAWIIHSEPGMATLDLANEIRKFPEVESAEPNWWRPLELK